MIVSELLARVKAMLKAANKPVSEAYILAENALGLAREQLLIYTDTKIDHKRQMRLLTDTHKRCSGYPLQYIIGSWEFYGLNFKVDERVLIPRADTEILVDYLLQNHKKINRLIDLCCGSGCIGLTFCKKTGTKTLLLDISKGAIEVCRQNARALQIEKDVEIIQKDILEGPLPQLILKAGDVIVSNPPYIKSSHIAKLQNELKYEPILALDGAEDGLKFYRALIFKWAKDMPKGVKMVVETGYDTFSEVEGLFRQAGFKDITRGYDYNKIVRMLSVSKD